MQTLWFGPYTWYVKDRPANTVPETPSTENHHSTPWSAIRSSFGSGERPGDVMRRTGTVARQMVSYINSIDCAPPRTDDDSHRETTATVGGWCMRERSSRHVCSARDVITTVRASGSGGRGIPYSFIHLPRHQGTLRASVLSENQCRSHPSQEHRRGARSIEQNDTDSVQLRGAATMMQGTSSDVNAPV